MCIFLKYARLILYVCACASEWYTPSLLCAYVWCICFTLSVCVLFNRHACQFYLVLRTGLTVGLDLMSLPRQLTHLYILTCVCECVPVWTSVSFCYVFFENTFTPLHIVVCVTTWLQSLLIMIDRDKESILLSSVYCLEDLFISSFAICYHGTHCTPFSCFLFSEIYRLVSRKSMAGPGPSASVIGTGKNINLNNKAQAGPKPQAGGGGCCK